jgi:TldD protein
MDPIATLDSTQKVALLEKVEKLARAKDPRVVQVMAGMAGEYDVVLVARADGTLAADVRRWCAWRHRDREQTHRRQVRREVGSRRRRRALRLRLLPRRSVIEGYVHDAVNAGADEPRIAPRRRPAR